MKEMHLDALSKWTNSEQDLEAVKAAYDIIMDFNMIARRGGLLLLEEEVRTMITEAADEEVSLYDPYAYRYLNGLDRLLAVLIMDVVDGEAPEYLYENGVNRYFAGGFTGGEALAACMIVEGVLALQMGENPRTMGHRLIGMLPPEAEDAVIADLLEEQKRAEQEEEAFELPESLFGELGREDSSALVKGLNAILLGLTDQEIQLVLSGTEDYILYRCLNIINGAARKRLFDNMSALAAKKTYEEMTDGYYSEVSQETGWALATKWLQVMMELEDPGEISFSGIDIGARSVPELIEMHKQEVIARNAEINRRIKELQYELENLEKQIIKED